jgi:hypothetical protein
VCPLSLQMQYKFFINRFNSPELGFEDKDSPLIELGGLDQEYLDEIISQLELVMSRQLPYFDFGREVYLQRCNHERCEVVNLFQSGKIEMTVPTKDILEMLIEWRDFQRKHGLATK